MTAWNIWREEPPPPGTWVRAKYRFGDEPQTVQTCRHGCCVQSWLGSMTLPSFWLLATEEEIDAELTMTPFHINLAELI